MSVPSGYENRFLRNQTDQFNSEVRTEEHSKIAESVKSGKDRTPSETLCFPCSGGDKADLECQLRVRKRN